MAALAGAALLAGIGALPAQQQPWKFILFGDSNSFEPGADVNTNVLGELARVVAAENPSFLLFLGDFSMSGMPASLALWTNAMTPVFRASVPVYPTVGNHDQFNTAALTNVFAAVVPDNGPVGEEQTTYALAYNDALVLVLNEFSSSNNCRVNQPWVDAVLATNTRPHVFAGGHLPAFKLLHGDCLGSYPTNRDIFWRSLSNANGRLYFSGHDHFYDHTRLDDGDGNPDNDLHHITTGTGGGFLYPDGFYDGNNGLWKPARIWHEPQYGYVSVEVCADRVTTVWHRRTETNSYALADVFSYSVLPRPVLRHSLSGGRLILSWSAAATLQAAPDPSGPFTNIQAAVPPFVVTDLSGPPLFYRLRLP